MFTKFTCTSGTSVMVRARTYEEWEQQEDQRLELLASVTALVDKQQLAEADAQTQKAYRKLRAARLATCVEGFAAAKKTLNMRDVDEIEQHIDTLERVAVPLGNSAPGGDGL